MALSWDALRWDEKDDIICLVDMLFSHIVELGEDIDSLWWYACSIDKSLALTEFSSYDYPAMDRILDHPLMDRYREHLAYDGDGGWRS
jgi:hypothetical protein